MSRRSICAGAVIALLSAAPAQAAVRISHDIGGQIGPYLNALESLRSSGQNVIIDGPCLSACTLLLGVIPRERICVTRRAQLGFHAAWHPTGNGRRVVSVSGTEVLWENYPPHIRQWLMRRGGLSPKMKFLAGRELTSMYPTCR